MLFGLKNFEIHDGPGVRTTVFLKGCPLRCVWCHNPESQAFKAELALDEARCVRCGRCAEVCPNGAHAVNADGHRIDRDRCRGCGECGDVCPAEALRLYGEERGAAELAAELARDRDFFESTGGGVTLSGGEPTAQYDFCLTLLRELRSRGVHTALDTCGYCEPERFRALLEWTDLVLFDVKAMDEAVHLRCTGVSNRLILENILLADSVGRPMELRYPYVPGWTDGEAEAIARFAAGLRNLTCLRVLGYHDFARRKYDSLGRVFPEIPVPSPAETASVIQRMRALGCPAMSPDDA